MNDSATFVHGVRRGTKLDAPELARLFTELGHPTTAEDVAARWMKWEAAGNVSLGELDRV
jgi:hypothetical protein